MAGICNAPGKLNFRNKIGHARLPGQCAYLSVQVPFVIIIIIKKITETIVKMKNNS
jgi:hypothetical protein